MSLSGSQLDQIHRAILAAYTRDELRRAVKVGMDVDFDAIAPERGFSDQLWTFIDWANRQERALELVQCAWEHNQGNSELAALWQEAQG